MKGWYARLPLAAAALCTAGVAQTEEIKQGGAADDNTLTEIVVTAQRRSERLVDVPLSVTPLSAAELAQSGIVATQDLIRVVPGLQLPVYGAYIQPAIRGVSSTGGDVGDSSNVAMYLDGVYLAAQPAQMLDLPDAQDIEVLKGPQGTLYGQNAEGGAIIITTASPSFAPTGHFSASFGNYNDVSGRGYVSGPLSDQVAFSLAGSYEDRDGFHRNVALGDRDPGLRSGLARAKLLWQPGENTSLTLTGFYARRDDSGLYSGFAYNANSSGYQSFPGAPVAADPQDTTVGSRADAIFQVYGTSLRGEFKLGTGTLSTTSAFIGTHVNQYIDLDYTAANVANVSVNRIQHDFTQEINFLSGAVGPWTFSAGLFYLKGRDGFQPTIFDAYFPVTLAPTPPGPVVFSSATYSTLGKQIGAVYAEVTNNLTSRLTLSVGGRYSYERQDGTTNESALSPQEIETPYSPATFKKFTPRVTARYALSPASNVYFSYSEGFKSGLISVTAFSDPPVKPEELKAFEIGYKGHLNDKLSTNLAAFHYNYSNEQVSFYNAPVYVYQNAASSRIDGVDLDVNYDVTAGLTLKLGLEYLDAKYRDFPQAGIYVPVAGGGNANANIDASGLRMIRAPQLTGNFSVNYRVDTPMGEVGAFAAAYHNSGFALEPSARIWQRAYTTVDAEMSVKPVFQDRLRFVLWGHNLTGKSYLQSLLQTNFADGASYSAPRTFGGRFEWSY